jgi:adenylate cyclase class IV
MEVKLKMSVRTAERINTILAHAITDIEEKEDLQKYFDCNDKDLDNIQKCRMQIVDSLTVKQ